MTFEQAKFKVYEMFKDRGFVRVMSHYFPVTDQYEVGIWADSSDGVREEKVLGVGETFEEAFAMVKRLTDALIKA